ncbi:MAG: alpha/beta hydrolase [Bifidobacterium sp.]|jgi:pimeloyl-ACP methyl ester carboxylesterase|nr:alpha/beta hydrolase [Bifidobacterium sp.]MCI1865844.1 alpha/beta hydrolase [Bifidobacterium sp.]
MPYAHNGNIALYYEDRGPRTGPAAVLVEGYTAQLVGWQPGFVERLNRRGLRTLLMDNRDVGLSDQLGDETQTGRRYTIADMADDVVAVADAAGLSGFHLIGESMGGMIVQQTLASHHDRIRSATMMFTTPGFEPRWMAHPESPESGSNEGLDRVDDRGKAMDLFVERERACHAGSAYAFDEVWTRKLAAMTYDRCYRPDGWRRQNAAMDGFAADEKTLASLSIPACVMHGRSDPFFSYEAGVHIAQLLVNAELHVYPGMAHEIPEPLWDEFADIIARTAARGESR